ncbi:MAG: amidohydrolase [Lentisphaeria bacterium]|nr:amidohydrolase [Lentisphaeria bacterium]
MRVFDIHTHYFPDALATKALASLVGNSGVNGAEPLQPCYDGTRAGLVKLMEDSNVSFSLNLPVATRPAQVESINAAMIAQNVAPIYNFGCIHPDTPNKQEVLQRLKAAGIRGIKLHPQYQSFQLEDPRAFEIYEICQELGLVIIFHCGKDGSYLPPFNSSPKRLLEVQAKFPQLKLVGGHFGGLEMWDEVETYLIGKPIYLDTSIFLESCSTTQILRMIRNHPEDYILFGSDVPWGNPEKSLEILLKLPISTELKEKICWKNSMNLLEML